MRVRRAVSRALLTRRCLGLGRRSELDSDHSEAPPDVQTDAGGGHEAVQ